MELIIAGLVTAVGGLLGKIVDRKFGKCVHQPFWTTVAIVGCLTSIAGLYLNSI